jgi:hypothetical protein
MKNANCKLKIAKCKMGRRLEVGSLRVARVRKYLALLALLASLQESSGNLEVFKIAQGCQVAALERVRCLSTGILGGESLDC